MLRDVFYYGKKPNVHPRERHAKNLKDARQQSRTEHFWIINEYCDYKGFDWEFDFELLPDEDVWAEDHNNVWPSQHQKDSGTWLCSKNNSEIIIYRNDVEIVKRKKVIGDNWIVKKKIDESRFDFSWHPDPTDPPYIYVWGNQWYSGKVESTIEYHVHGATEKKYLDNIAFLLPDMENYEIRDEIDLLSFDFSWQPNPSSPPYIYAWGNQWNAVEDRVSLVYKVPGATEYKYFHTKVKRLPVKDNWEIPDNVDVTGFDFSWEPSPADNPYIYQFGTQWQKDGGPRYVVKGAKEIKYVDVQKATATPTSKNWTIPKNIDVSGFDFSWHPDDISSPYIYQFGTQWQKTGGPRYIVEGATEIKYIDTTKAKALPNKSNFKVLIDIDEVSFDYSWHPDENDDPYVYVFGNQWHNAEIEPTVEYRVRGATEKKYINNIKVNTLADMTCWKINYPIHVTKFDFTWRPDPGSPPYIYVFGSNLYPAEEMSTVEYHVPGATEYKYVSEIVAQLAEDKSNWVIPNNVDITDFDFTWHPNPKDPAYIYYAGTQWQKTGGPKYVVKGATEIKYLENRKVKALPNKDKWVLPPNIDVSDFDFSWHPDDTEPPYIYQFGTQWALTGGPKYVMPDATEVKYMDNPVAKALPDKTNWIVPENIDSESFDFSWHPYVEDQPYIYVFGTQWQKTGGPRYVTPGADEMSPVKYIDRRILKSKRLPDKSNWEIPANIDPNSVDYSWHPDDTEQPYIYEFGTQWHDRGGPKYVIPDATAMKYSSDIKGKLIKERDNWEILTPIVEETFDFSWHPHPNDPPFIYVFGNNLYPAEEMETVRYVVDGATQVKYVNDVVATLAEDKTNWEVPEDVDTSNFDFSWKPHPKAPAYIYEFGTQWQKTGGPRYVVPGAKEVNYIPGSKAIYKPKTRSKYWEIPESLDISEFDFSWHPDKTDKAYIYQFGTQWAMSGGPRYVVPGATEIKYMDNPVAKMKSNKSNWQIPDDIDVDSFDFSWHPYTEEQPYIYQFGTQWQKTGGPRYISLGADEMSPVKYIDRRILKATKLPNKKNFEILNNFVVEDFDYSWHPDETDGAYIYTFGNTQYPAEIMPTIVYKTEGATKVKYINEPKAKLGSSKTNWQINDNLDVSLFDFSWLPDPNDPPYIYEFGTQWQKTNGPKYIVPGATEVKYVSGSKAKIKANSNDKNWQVLMPVSEFDFSWHPDNTEELYIYVFGNTQYPGEIMPTVQYVMDGATTVKYVNEVKAKLKPNMSLWTVPENIDSTSFDFSWVPDPTSPAYIYEFATVWNNRGGPRYVMPNATDFKYIEDIKAKTKSNKQNWQIPDNINVDDFDFSWVPHPEAPAYIYQFGTLTNDNDGPRYITPGNNGEVVRLLRVSIETVEIKIVPKYYITTTLDNLVHEHKNELFWAIRQNIDYTNFNFDWRPNIEQARYVHVFGSPESEMTQTYFVSGPMWEEGYRELNFVEQDKKASEEYLAELFVQPDIFLVDRGNPETQERFEQLKSRFTNVSKTRFLNSWVDTINRCINRSNTEVCWILNSELDYNNFDFKYYPNPWQLKMVHVFGTQWSHWGTTFMVNRDTFTEDTKYIKIIEHLNNLNFVKDRRAIATNNLYDIIVINHGNKECDKVVASLEARACGKKVTTVNYDTSYVNTIKNIVNNLNAKKEQFVWITSSVCSYGEFDFTYICDPFAKDSLHVFPSDRQKFGDTFLLDVNKAKEAFENIELLQQYPKVNYNQTIRAKRLSAPVIKTGQDTHVEAVKSDFDFPYAIFQTEDITTVDNEPMNLWAPDTKSILITSTGGTRIIVPKEAKEYVKDQLYDYPYIKTASKLLDSKPLDIVFLSNGEKCAEENYEHLLAVTKGLKNRVVRVDGVNGRVDAYHAAVKASQTNWTFTVFAKLKVDSKFDFSWQPDRLQMPKHYIFHAKNPVNGLEYGHQGMIAYNKALTLNNFGDGLDFTLDDPHETVEILSGTATFNTDAYSTWRTAFREVIKLKSDYTDISQERLKVWLTKAKGKFAKDCLQGANDAVEYYDQVNGDIDQLRLSYEWSWLKEYYNRKYK